jgi:hypothetical protein
MVEQRHAQLEGMGHAGAIHLGQDVAGQVGHEIGVLHLIERVQALRLAPMGPEDLRAGIALQITL